MSHPTEQQLQAWIDGDVDAASHVDEYSAHVEVCSRCRQFVDSTRQFGTALRVWAEDGVPALENVDDLFAKITASAPANGVDAAVPAKSMGEVVPLGSHRKDRRVWGMGALALAAAAAAVLFLRSSTRGPSGERPMAHTTSVDASGPSEILPNETRFAVNTLQGSVVLAVDPGGPRSVYSVLNIEGGREGTTNAVVWIDDEAKVAPGTVQ